MNFGNQKEWPDWLLKMWEDKAVPLPMMILVMAEKFMGEVSQSRDRAASTEWPEPITPADFLGWMEDEANLQRDQAEHSPDEAAERLAYAENLELFASLLRGAGVEPTPIFDEAHLSNLLVHTLIALSQRVETGEDYGRIFDAAQGANLFEDLLMRFRAVNKARATMRKAEQAERSVLIAERDECLGVLRDLTGLINLDKDDSYFLCKEAKPEIDAANRLIIEHFGEALFADLDVGDETAEEEGHGIVVLHIPQESESPDE